MKIKKILGFSFILFLLMGCTQANLEEENTNVKLTKLNNQSEINLDLSDQVKEDLKNNSNIKTVHGANLNNNLVLAMEIPQMSRFNIKEIEKDVKTKIKNNFKNVEVHLSTDKKIVMELEQLERKLDQSSMTKKELNKELKRIIKLMNEET